MKNRLIALAAVCLLIPGILLAESAAKKTVAGVWEVKMAPVGQSQSPFLSLAMYGSDGSFTTCGGYKAIPSIPAVQEVGTELGPGYGRWAAKGDREFRLTFYSIMWKEGLANAYQRAQETLVLSESGDEYTGHAQVDFLDANWNVVFSTTSEVKGTRLETPATPIAQPAEKNQLVGVWEVKVSPAGQSQSPQLGIAMYSADGNFTTGTVGGYKAFPPNSRDSRRCERARPRVRPLGRHERQRVPVDVLLRDVESRPRERIPAGPGHLGPIGVGQRIHGTCPSGFFGCKLERRIQHHH